jgi:regulation of enolase protein 1 (concanavalin A-like superfamily)
MTKAEEYLNSDKTNAIKAGIAYEDSDREEQLYVVAPSDLTDFSAQENKEKDDKIKSLKKKNKELIEKLKAKR